MKIHKKEGKIGELGLKLSYFSCEVFMLFFMPVFFMIYDLVVGIRKKIRCNPGREKGSAGAEQALPRATTVTNPLCLPSAILNSALASCLLLSSSNANQTSAGNIRAGLSPENPAA